MSYLTYVHVMKKRKQKSLEKAGWRVGDAQGFLKLSDGEAALVALKQRLVQLVREKRGLQEITQASLAELLGSSQSRVAKLENGSSDISLDLIMRALLAMGVSNKEIGKAITSS